MIGLPAIEREAFLAALAQKTCQAREDNSHLGLILIDINNLGQINLQYGFATGDAILTQCSAGLREVSRLPDTLFRIGGHLFAFILPQLQSPAFIFLASNRIRQQVETARPQGHENAALRVNIGIAVNRGGQLDNLQTLALAEASLRRAKMGHADTMEYFARSADESDEDLQLEQHFNLAMQENALELYYQPKVRLADNRIEGAEALLRWNTGDSRALPAQMLLQMAEHSGKGYELSKWSIHHALRRLKKWREELDVSLAINFEAYIVCQADFPALLRDAIAIWGVEPSAITIEITESAIIEDKKSGFENLLELKNAGFRISIDDFGTGYSSLSYFKDIPATEVKIDRSFVSSMLENEMDRELVRITIQIARLFGLSVVAEGVEDEATFNALRDLGCDYIQGYYISRPLPEREFREWVRNWRP